MTWFKVDDALHSHPKWLAATPRARALWVTAGSWCAAHLTDGHIPNHVLPLFAARASDAAELVRLSLWEKAEDGWIFHDWDLFQPSAESVEAERAANRERQARWREKARESRHASRRDNNRDSHVNDTVSNGPPDPTRPDLSTSGGVTTPTTAPDASPPTDPRRCPKHQHDDYPPPCGACADARRAHDTPRTNGRTNPLDEQQAAARARAERTRRQGTGEACPTCSDTGWTTNNNGDAIPCTHHTQAAS